MTKTTNTSEGKWNAVAAQAPNIMVKCMTTTRLYGWKNRVSYDTLRYSPFLMKCTSIETP